MFEHIVIQTYMTQNDYVDSLNFQTIYTITYNTLVI